MHMDMTLRLTPAQDRALTLLAETHGTSKQEAAVRAIVSTAARTLNDAQVAELARNTLADRATLERRIRQVSRVK